MKKTIITYILLFIVLKLMNLINISWCLVFLLPLLFILLSTIMTYFLIWTIVILMPSPIPKEDDQIFY